MKDLQGIRRFGVVSNGEKIGTDLLAARVRHYLERRNLHCVINPPDAQKVEFDLNDVDCLIVIGGDGTILRQVNAVAVAALPILGINMGRVGFLSEVEPTWVEDALEALAVGRYRIEERTLLAGEVDGEHTLALNDFMLCKKHPSRTIEVGISVDGKVIAEYACDGILVSTPTGSTGYALSAGGPILSPELPLVMIVPVSAHSLSARPMLFSAGAKVGLQLLDDHDNNALVCADGDTVFREFSKGDIVTVRQAKHNVRFLRIREDNYIQLIRNKLG